MLENNKIFIEFAYFITFFSGAFVSFLFILRSKFSWFRQLDKKTQIQFADKLVSCIHSVTITIRALYVLFTDPNLQENKLIYNSETLCRTYQITLGFFIFDTLIMFIYKNEMFDWKFLIHHVASILGSGVTMSYGTFSYFALIRSLSEASTVFIQIRWFLLTLKLEKTKKLKTKRDFTTCASTSCSNTRVAGKSLMPHPMYNDPMFATNSYMNYNHGNHYLPNGFPYPHPSYLNAQPNAPPIYFQAYPRF
ncbi:unnamed protein product [Brachionus calyciflorus]|uniref:TLC domain-containing protein n=1 Tax=Brachionus calyciflorus TaxID=104777 RepID=A0A813XMQ0_9BILA|nr:unnamed protein product [Brachionus calyciflorus]